MLTVWGANGSRNCDGISRRAFLQVGALGAGLTLADLLRLRAAGLPDNSPPKHKAVILIWMAGGPPHIDMYDMKPDAPVEIRGDYRSIPTNVPGIRLCEDMPLQARIADKLAIVRGLQMANNHHSFECLTGYDSTPNRPVAVRPALGCVVSKIRAARGNRTGAPPYVSGLREVGPDGGSGGSAEQPLYVGRTHAPLRVEHFTGEGMLVRNLQLSSGMTLERLQDRRNLLQSFDTLRRDLDTTGQMVGMDACSARALDMIVDGRNAFDISREPHQIRAMYGNNTQFLIARRLVEAGVSVVTLWNGDKWDNHGNYLTGTRAILPRFDQAIHALVTDIYQRGLGDDVTVLAWGEFGRTPRIGQDHAAGSRDSRNHWPQASFALLAGGGLKTGQAVGETDRFGERARGRPFRAPNVLATVYHALGIRPEDGRIIDDQGRPQNMLEGFEHPIAELI
ncbi:MAG: DUF1501 domain-containing protein [Gemmataceae bacterium]|nr:DUF1501 domain-containing protein [Gemmataceae bacterium]